MNRKYRSVKIALVTGEFHLDYSKGEKPLGDYYYELGNKYQKSFLTSKYDYELKQWIVTSGKKKVIATIQLNDEEAKAAEKCIADRVTKILTEEHFCF